MKAIRFLLLLGLAAGVWLAPCTVCAQFIFVPPNLPPPLTTPDAQRQAMTLVQTRVSWVKNATRTAPSYSMGGDVVLWQSFEALRLEYFKFTRSLNAQQTAYGANELAELSAGLDILQEAFSNYQQDLAAGRQASLALRDMCRVLGKASDVWLAEFNADCARLRVGR